jgi:methionyl-tRNA synthetase
MKDIISYDDFAKLDIAIGTILSVEIVPEADRLLRLEVDFGEDGPRQIVSGIREYFENIEDLVGRQCPFLVNLQPRMIKGLESQGMILACEHEGLLGLLHPSASFPPGTRIR